MFYNYRPDGLSEKGMSNQTPAAHWRENGEPDPHAKCTNQERAELPLGNLTDDELANEVFLHGDSQPSIAEVIAGTAKMPIVYLTAAKERIRWLSRKLVRAEQREQELLAALEEARRQGRTGEGDPRPTAEPHPAGRAEQEL